MKCHTPYTLLMTTLLFILSTGCARVTTYNIDIAYNPQSIITGIPAEKQRHVVTVAVFKDERSAEDLLKVGKRVRMRGEEVPVKAFVPPGISVASALKEYLFRAGFTVGGGIPSWDGNPHSMDKDWGDLVIGGSIKELNITSASGVSMVDYVANVKLGIVIGDIRQGKIVWTTTVNSSSSVKGVRFSQKKLAEELNSVLSSVIESTFRDDRIVSLIE